MSIFLSRLKNFFFNEYDASDATSKPPIVGKYITFGRYPQINSNTRDPIEWLVLEVSDNEALLISRYVLDCKSYHNKFGPMKWEMCDLRAWLNNDFMKSAFSEEEIQRIKFSELRTDHHRYPDIYGNSEDQVFCLSIAETEQYFSNKENLPCQPTDYARYQGVDVDKINGCCKWWLRSTSIENAAFVGTDGRLYRCGVGHDLAVRPALWVNL